MTEVWLGRVLRIGVMAAAAIILLGLGLFLAGDHGPDRISRDEALGRGVPIHTLTPRAIVEGIEAGEPTAVIQLGLIVLILTPVVRVAMTALLFGRQRDWPFAFLAGAVLVLLMLGLLGIAT